MKLDEKYFQTVSFNDSDISKLIDNAFRDLSIAQNDKYTEVQFNYAYQSILKIGIAVLADVMRQKRHADLYNGGEVVTEKEAEEYVAFASQVLELSAKLLGTD